MLHLFPSVVTNAGIPSSCILALFCIHFLSCRSSYGCNWVSKKSSEIISCVKQKGNKAAHAQNNQSKELYHSRPLLHKSTKPSPHPVTKIFFYSCETRRNGLKHNGQRTNPINLESRVSINLESLVSIHDTKRD